MFEAISKNWGYLTTIGTIVAVAFGGGIWMKTSLDTLEALPNKVNSIDQRLEALEGISKSIKQSTCALEARTEMSKNDVLTYTVNLEIDKIREQTMQLDNLDEDWTEKQKRKYERLGKREQELIRQRNEFQSRYDQQFQIYGDCK